MLARIGIALVVVSSIGTACTNQDSFTNLNPDGPPALAEVRMKETYTDATNPSTFLSRRVFAFGTFPGATSDIDHAVTSAAVTSQSLRIIMDELLQGNRLEEIQCRAQVNDTDALSPVPDGATPDDIAACSVNADALEASCQGDHAVCICEIATGCGNVAMGHPVGVLDVNNDGAADNTTFKAGAVGIRCGTGAAAIDVPIDLDMSYWNPSGDQQVPAAGGYDALGPAIVLVPKGGVIPTNITCGLTFAADVLDKQGNQVCAPPMGRPASCDQRIDDCQADLECTPGDTSAFSFKTEALRITVLGINNGDLNISATNPIFANANAPLSATSLANIVITPAPPADLTITQPMPTQVKFTPVTPLTANTMYTITFPVTVTDSFGQGLPAPYSISFTTAP
jgi:hypothetical protein